MAGGELRREGRERMGNLAPTVISKSRRLCIQRQDGDEGRDLKTVMMEGKGRRCV